MFSKLIYPGLNFSFTGIADWFTFSLFIMPIYFGIRLAFFDLTALRFFEILIVILIWKNPDRRQRFIDLVLKSRHTIFILLYMFVVLYTNIIHPSIGTIFYWMMNGIAVFYIMSYLITDVYGIELFLKKIRSYTYFVFLCSVFEIVTKKSPFSFLNTLHKGGEQIQRFGAVRLIGNYTTTNGYSMFLCMLFPLLCYDIEKKRVDILKNIGPILFLILIIFLTGARLAVGIVILEFGLCCIIQNRKTLYKELIIILIAVPIIVIFLIAFRNIPFVQSILRTFFTAFDEVFNTSISLKFGADATILYNSSRYRELLLENTILDNWLNPFLGKGGSYAFHVYTEGYNIRSVDNFYVGQYIAYAWPGLITWLIMSLSCLKQSLKRWVKRREQLSWIISVMVVCYYISLWYLDQLQTFPVMLGFFGLINAMEMLNKK